MKYEEERHTLVLYSTSLCNLNCSYCYIDKNPVLKDIDLLLEQSFKDENYYFNFTKEIFPDPNQLKRVEIWGGEPTLYFDRIFPTVKKLISYYPNLSVFMFSTNFIGSYWFDQFNNFLQLLQNFTDRKFEIMVQLSIDGPKRINDLGRGEGTTEKFLINFKKLIYNLQKSNWIPENIKIQCFFKPTLSLATIPLLQTEEEIYNYYKFFDDLSKIIMYYNSEKFYFWISLPNTAEPAPVTQNDGILFANLCKICKELEIKNKEQKIFSVYKNLVPYSSLRRPINQNKFLIKNLDNFKNGCSSCGIGYHTVGLLPNKKISLCHNGFVDLLQDYKIQCSKNVKDEIIIEKLLDKTFFDVNKVIKNTNCNIEELELWADMINKFENTNSTFQMANIAAQIINLAKNGLILPKYAEQKEAMKATRYFAYINSFCIRNNLSASGCMIAPPLGTMKLLLNGALDYIIDEKNEE